MQSSRPAQALLAELLQRLGKKHHNQRMIDAGLRLEANVMGTTKTFSDESAGDGAASHDGARSNS